MVEPHLLERYGSPEGAAAYRRKYERTWLRRLSDRRERRVVERALRQATGGTRVDRALDCPCGAGRMAPVLFRHAAHVTAADLSAAMVAEARDALGAEAGLGRVAFSVASASALPFEDGAFDLALCHRLLHHLAEAPTRVAILRELARVARRAVVVSFNDASAPKARWQARRGRRRRRHVLSPQDLAREAGEAGLRLEPPVRRLSGLFSLVAVAVLRPAGARN